MKILRTQKLPAVLILLSLISLFALSGCGGGSSNSRPSNSTPSDNLPENSLPENNLPEDNSPEDNLPDNTPNNSLPENNLPEDNSPDNNLPEDNLPNNTPENSLPEDNLQGKTLYTDANGDTAYIPAGFTVSAKQDEQTINTGLVVIGPDESEFVWIPTAVTELSIRDFGSYFSNGDSISNYHDETSLPEYQAMAASTKLYGGFYIGRYEASQGTNGIPASKPVTSNSPGRIWVQFSPQDTVAACQKLYEDNDTVQGFFPWGANWDTVLQWLVDSGCMSLSDIKDDSSSWGNYSNDSFSQGAGGNYTGVWDEAKANNIYDLAGNNWEWTQERRGSNYVARGGGYNLMGGACPGNRYPAAVRDPLPGNNHHPNITFRAALYLK